MNTDKATKFLITTLLSKSAVDTEAIIQLKKIFLQPKYHVNMEINSELQTPLLLATINKKYGMVSWLLKNYNDTINVSKQDKNKKSPLSAAMNNDDDDLFLLFMNNKGNIPEIRDVKTANGVTPLMFAIQHDNFSFFSTNMIKTKEDFNFYDKDTNGNTALDIFMRLADFNSSMAKSILLLIYKFKFEYEISFIYFLIENNYKFIINIFNLETINKINNDGYTLLFYAVKKNKHNSVRSLLKFDADPNITCIDDGQESSVLISSIKNLSYNIALTLLTHEDINVNYATPKGKTALIALSEIEWTEFKHIHIFELMTIFFKKKETLRKNVVMFMLGNREKSQKFDSVLLQKVYAFITKQKVKEKITEMLTVFKNILKVVIKGLNDAYQKVGDNHFNNKENFESYLRYIKLFLDKTDGSVTIQHEIHLNAEDISQLNDTINRLVDSDSKSQLKEIKGDETFLSYAKKWCAAFNENYKSMQSNLLVEAMNGM